MATKPDDHLGMSDEDFLNKPEPSAAPVTSQEEFEGEKAPEPEAKVEEPKAEEKSEESAPKEEQKEDVSKESEKDSKEADSKIEPEKEKTPSEKAAEAALALTGSEEKKADPTKKHEPKAEEPKKDEQEAKSEAPNYEELYKQIMAPFTANGKKIELKDTSEVIQLMQMGANYTRKLQELAPHRKLITMLGNHNLLDESKINFLIALDKKDPEAVKKLIIDSGIDPLDIDTKVQPAYQEGSYQVTDQEVAFRTTLDELSSSDEGKQTLTDINTWDQASKDMLWQHPEVMPIIHEQRENGVYAKITAEMDRQRTLGQLLPTMPFLEAYKTVGDQLDKAGAFNDLKGPEKTEVKATPSAEPAKIVVATDRAAEPKPIVDNGDKAGAASPTRAAPVKAKETVNFLSMSDDDFVRAGKLEGRV